MLPFERHIRGEDDKPLPPSKPRKPYKRNLDGKVTKADGKRKRTDRDLDSEVTCCVSLCTFCFVFAQIPKMTQLLFLQSLTPGSPDAACQSGAGIHAHSSLWAATSDRHQSDCSQPSRGTGDLCTSVYARAPLPQVPASSPWTGHIPSAAGEVISPLEKKKRMAQASLNLPPSPQSEDKDRPSVIRCSPSPALASSSQNCNSSEGSPLPLSSSSSRSPSPYSVSSEDGPAGSDDKPASNAELAEKCSGTIRSTPGCNEESTSEKSKDPAGQNEDVSHVGFQSVDTDLNKAHMLDFAWKRIHKGRNVSNTYQLLTPSPYAVKSDWVPASTSSFSKVIPKSAQLLRPAPIRPSYRVHQSRSMQQEDSLTCVKKMMNVAPWPYQTERREKSSAAMPKPLLTQQTLSHSSAPLTVSYVLADFDKLGRYSRHQAPLHPAFLPLRMRLPQSQPTYSHIPVNPAHSALFGSAIYSYPYPIPMWSPQTGYTLPATVYHHKL